MTARRVTRAWEKTGRALRPWPAGRVMRSAGLERYITAAWGGTPTAGGKRAVLLLHQTPFGLSEWVDIHPLLAEMGFDTIAPDNPGYGMSDPPPESVTVADLADNLVDLLDGLNVERVAVARAPYRGRNRGIVCGPPSRPHGLRRSAWLSRVRRGRAREKACAGCAAGPSCGSDGTHMSEIFFRNTLPRAHSPRAFDGQLGDAGRLVGRLRHTPLTAPCSPTTWQRTWTGFARPPESSRTAATAFTSRTGRWPTGGPISAWRSFPTAAPSR